MTYPLQSSRVLVSCLTFGFTEEANLDQRALWPTALALTELTAAEEALIGGREESDEQRTEQPDGDGMRFFFGALEYADLRRVLSASAGEHTHQFGK